MKPKQRTWNECVERAQLIGQDLEDEGFTWAQISMMGQMMHDAAEHTSGWEIMKKYVIKAAQEVVNASKAKPL